MPAARIEVAGMGDMQHRAILNAAAVADADFVHVSADDGHGPYGAVIAHDHITDDYGTFVHPGPFTKLWCDTLVSSYICHYIYLYRVFPKIGGACGVGLSKTLRSHGWSAKALHEQAKDGLLRTLSATQELLALRGGAERTRMYSQRVLERPTPHAPSANT